MDEEQQDATPAGAGAEMGSAVHEGAIAGAAAGAELQAARSPADSPPTIRAARPSMRRRVIT